MNYTKEFKTYAEQADQLIARGLLADRDKLIERLGQVNYYRLSAYWHPFCLRNPDAPGERLDVFRPGTTLDMVWANYTFDRQLRIITMDAIERVEVAVKSKLIYLLGRDEGRFAHLKSGNFRKFVKLRSSDHNNRGWHEFNFSHRKFKNDLRRWTKRSEHERFVHHYRTKYTSEEFLPLWMITEVVPFDGALTLVRHLRENLQDELAKEFGLSSQVLLSWLMAIKYIRNICAHHGRLYNRMLATRPHMPSRNKYPWLYEVELKPERIFTVLTILRYFMNRVAPGSAWTCRLLSLLEKYERMPRLVMGFPEGWERCSAWINNCNALNRIEEELLARAAEPAMREA